MTAQRPDRIAPVIATAGGRVELSGDLLIGTVADLVSHAPAPGADVQAVDLSRVERMDTAGAWFVLDLAARLSGGDAPAPIEGASDSQATLLDTVRENMPRATPAPEPRASLTDRIARLGRATYGVGLVAVEMTAFLGQVVAALAGLVLRPRRLRLTSLVHHMQEVGWNAIPIVTLMAFLIGVVLAFQGSAQLRQFGAEVFVVDLIAIAVLRELGILLTAIIVAGRSGSAFTAAIGSMKMREEVSAMRTLGLDPVQILVVPRVLALFLTLPLLGFIADVAGLVGGAVMSWIELGVSPVVFQSRLVANIDLWQFGVGIIKAPFFALIIGVIGCYEGLKVGGNAESLGRLTSTSVVVAIFMVIVVDALFSIFFALVGV
ncbi:MlaE family lipid ABC transporter permease subunit [Palleronia sediminis]|uniref:MlaE family lipid ABC transporter permease subunit n=1 Tax=Palleronia sediminis TaxID=2547833 RepID=A0A4R6AE10_9RHOB|nr:MlaE family lipid ABC transporter permease subunit [Palleronia sediminis]TDL81262.1 MlaE family lipid ABC transporter permease subunit [Palleronia sediminis]